MDRSAPQSTRERGGKQVNMPVYLHNCSGSQADGLYQPQAQTAPHTHLRKHVRNDTRRGTWTAHMILVFTALDLKLKRPRFGMLHHDMTAPSRLPAQR